MTKVFNLDAVVTPEMPSIQINGKKHKMATPTVGGMFDKMKVVEKLGVAASPLQEMEVMAEMILSSFPTLTMDDLRGWTMAQAQALLDFVQSVGGEVVTDNAEEAKQGNDQPAS